MIVNESERRGRIFFFIWTGILFVGIAVMLYPKVGKIWNTGRQSRVVDGYERSVEKLDVRKEEEMIAQTRAYNVMLLEQNNPVPNDKNADSYGALLNMTSDGVMGYLEIPAIRLKLPIYHGTGDFAICNGAGHVEGSSFPIGGKGTHAVLSSHRGLPGAKLFSDLDKLKVGDYFTITVLRQTIFYQIDRIDIVEPEETELLALDKEKDYCTLLTCTPYGINTKRLLVRGVRCEMTERAEPIRTGEKSYRGWYAVIGLNLFVAGVIVHRKRKRKRRITKRVKGLQKVRVQIKQIQKQKCSSLNRARHHLLHQVTRAVINRRMRIQSRIHRKQQAVMLRRRSLCIRRRKNFLL